VPRDCDFQVNNRKENIKVWAVLRSGCNSAKKGLTYRETSPQEKEGVVLCKYQGNYQDKPGSVHYILKIIVTSRNCELEKPIISDSSTPQFPFNNACFADYIILNILLNAKFNFINYCPQTFIIVD